MSVNAGNDKEPSASLPPQPDPDFDTRGFWDATAQGELKMCHCSACGLWMMPPLEKCRKCAAPTRFDKVQGTGTIYTFIVQRQGAVSGFLSTLPYTVAIVELDDGHWLEARDGAQQHSHHLPVQAAVVHHQHDVCLLLLLRLPWQ